METMVPALPHMVQTADGYCLAGMRCNACGQVVERPRLACPACGERKALDEIQLATRGNVHSHTVVHRSYPGIETPFVAAIVDLDGGGTVRGTLTGVDPLADVPGGLRVAMAFRDSGQRDRAGNALLSYVFVPEGFAQ